MKVIFSTVGDVRQFVNFNGDIGNKELSPYFEPCQRYLSKFIGSALLEDLGTDQIYQGDRLELFNLVGIPLANLIVLSYVQVNNISVGQSGIHRTKTTDSSDVFEWQLDRLERSLINNAFNGIEALLEFLNSNLDKYPLYGNSAEYQREKSKLIPSATLFSEYYQIDSSRLIYMTLSASMRTAEVQIRRVLGNTLTPLLGNNLSDSQKEQLDAARRALAYLTISRALRERLINITEQGVQVLGIAQVGTINYRNAPSDKQLERSILYFDEQAAGFISDLAELLKEAPTPGTSVPAGSPVINKRIVGF